MASVTIAISSDFFVAFANLPKKIQKKTQEFIERFSVNRKTLGIHTEKIKNTDGKFYSARVDQEYRSIYVKPEGGETYLFVWVDHHDEAYEWALKRKCSVNSMTGAIQIYAVMEDEVVQPSPSTKRLFEDYTDEQLLSIGVPAEQLSYVRSIATHEELDDARASIPADAFEYLLYLADGFTYEDVLAEVNNLAKKQKSTDDLAEALRNGASLRSFVVVEDDAELDRLLSAPLEKWRTFLHPTQREIVEHTYNGPVRVLGGAGTGKTVVAMHRARYLARTLDAGNRILFTTYTTNLAADIAQNLSKLCSPSEFARIEVKNLDAWTMSFLRRQDFAYEVSYDESDFHYLWEEALADTGCSLSVTPSFLAEEWAEVVLTLNELSLDEYLHARRTGRGARLPRKDRIAIWDVFVRYQELMREHGIFDIGSAMLEARKIIDSNPERFSYASIIVDEAQDFSASAMRLIRALAGEEHKNDIMIAGDSHQRIYGKRVVLLRCGINIRGRSKRLSINYRTPEQIRQSAVKVISGFPWDDLDGKDDISAADEVTQSLVFGRKPDIYEFYDMDEEVDWVSERIFSMLESGVDDKDICLVARVNDLAREYANELEQRGLETLLLEKAKKDDRSRGGIRVATMHRVKGLEFESVFLAGMNDDVVPLRYVLDEAKTKDEKEIAVMRERSLVYVAMTRAKSTTTITSSGPLSDIFNTVSE